MEIKVVGTVERTNEHNRNGLEGWIDRSPPFDCILGSCAVPGCPGGDLGLKSHGRGSARYRWVLRGEGLAVEWSWFADEHLPESIECLDAANGGKWDRRSWPMGVDLSHHTATPMHADQGQSPSACDLLGIPSCFFSGSSWAADIGLALLGTDGEEAVWSWLEASWRGSFKDLMATMNHAHNHKGTKNAH